MSAVSPCSIVSLFYFHREKPITRARERDEQENGRNGNGAAAALVRPMKVGTGGNARWSGALHWSTVHGLC